ncbi:MAG TPA: hypothetical protein VH022_14515 [Candidatus Acidoferrum sp.]|nr:hypothetical protein [Candidatus Acidoferrum sp.]
MEIVTEELVVKFAQAIAIAEGFGRPGAVPTRANNPGDLTDDGDVGLGTIQTAGKYAAKITIYRTVDDGWNALFRKVRRMLEGHSEVYPLSFTIAQVAKKYCGNLDWGIDIARELEVSLDTTLSGLVTQYWAKQETRGPVNG